jgi:hypothetical protein
MPRISATVIRKPRMHGRPCIWSGSIVILVKRSDIRHLRFQHTRQNDVCQGTMMPSRTYALFRSAAQYATAADSGADVVPAPLLPSASCSLDRTASARIEPSQPLRIGRYVLSISMNDLIARRTGHQACGSLHGRGYLFADHSLSFAPGAFAATHQLHHPKRNDAIRFQRQHHQRIKHPPPST